jgi:hypothetical protein
MNEQEILNKIEEQDRKIEEIQSTFRKAKKVLIIFVIISVLAFILPFIGLMTVIPSFLNSYSEVLELTS